MKQRKKESRSLRNFTAEAYSSYTLSLLLLSANTAAIGQEEQIQMGNMGNNHTHSHHASDMTPNISGEGGKEHLAKSDALWRLLRPVRFKLLYCAILSALGAAAGFAPYIAVAEIARNMLGSQEVSGNMIWMWVIIGAIGACLRLLFVFASSRLGHYADAELLHDVRVRIVSKLGILPLGWFRDSGSGAIKKRMTNDLEEMHQLIAHALGELVGAGVAMIVGFTYLLLVDWQMSLITMAVLLVMVVSYRIAMRSVTTHMTRLLNAEGGSVQQRGICRWDRGG